MVKIYKECLKNKDYWVNREARHGWMILPTKEKMYEKLLLFFFLSFHQIFLYGYWLIIYLDKVQVEKGLVFFLNMYTYSNTLLSFWSPHMRISAMDLSVSTRRLLLASVTVWFLYNTEYKYLKYISKIKISYVCIKYNRKIYGKKIVYADCWNIEHIIYIGMNLFFVMTIKKSTVIMWEKTS